MDFGYTIIKGVIQGLTEFLPVSSTAHLTFTSALFKMMGWQEHVFRPGEEEFFDILLHLGTLAAVVYYFRRDLIRTLLVWQGKEAPLSIDSQSGIYLKKLPLLIAVSMTVTVVFILGMLKGTGLIMQAFGWTTARVENLSDYYFAHPHWVAIHLMITGGLLFFTDKMTVRARAGQSFNYQNAGIIGLFQGFAAIFHGISRSGSTISAGLLTGLDRVTATRYSFLLSIPTFLMAAVYEFLKLGQLGYILELNWPAMLTGVLFSAVIGYFCVKYLIQFVAKHSLVVFSYYCWTVAALMLILFYFYPIEPVLH